MKYDIKDPIMTFISIRKFLFHKNLQSIKVERHVGKVEVAKVRVSKVVKH
jgi:hypothetical protein